MQNKRKGDQKANEEERDTLTVSPSPVPIKYTLGKTPLLSPLEGGMKVNFELHVNQL
jgi:hypothetical protein